jgi:hypothetical protein
MLVSCKAGVVPPTTTDTTTTKTETVILHDTILTTEKDSSYYRAYLDCVNGKVIITPKVKTKKGSYLQPPKVNIKDNILQVDCEAEAQKLFTKWKEKFISEHRATIQRIPYPVEKELTWWQKSRMTLGSIFLVLLLLIALVVALRFSRVI